MYRLVAGIGLASRSGVKTRDLGSIDRFIARARIVLSLLASASVYVDPVIGGPFTIDSIALAVLGLHLAYGTTMLYFVSRGVVPAHFQTFGEILDMLFATAVAFVTEGATSPSYVFFCFAILAASCREAQQATLRVTAASVLLYMLVILLLYENAGHLYVMRPAYLGLIGCLAAFLGQERAQFEAR